MTGEQRYNELMDKARQANAQRDKLDRANGAKTPKEAGQIEVVRTARVALAAGIRGDSWECVAEALALLEELG